MSNPEALRNAAGIFANYAAKLGAAPEPVVQKEAHLEIDESILAGLQNVAQRMDDNGPAVSATNIDPNAVDHGIV